MTLLRFGLKMLAIQNRLFMSLYYLDHSTIDPLAQKNLGKIFPRFLKQKVDFEISNHMNTVLSVHVQHLIQHV